MASIGAGVKAEPDEEDADEEEGLERGDTSKALETLGDPVPVPPGVVLDKLSALLCTGRVLLRFNAGDSWGANGIVCGRWSSFSVGSDGVCRFVDEVDWRTGDGSEWADSELQQLEELRQEAEKLPVTEALQPSALKPGLCRRAVFQFHRAEFARKRRKVSQQATPSSGATPPVAAKKQEDEPETAASDEATMPESLDFPSFMAVVKKRLLEAGQKKLYKEFLVAASKGTDRKAIAQILAGHPDLVSQIPSTEPNKPGQQGKGGKAQPERLQKGAQKGAQNSQQNGQQKGQQKGKQKSQPQGQQQAQAKPQQPAPAPKVEKMEETEETIETPSVEMFDPESKILGPLQTKGGCAASMLVCAILSGRAKPSLRLRLLRYLRSELPSRGRAKEVLLLRGPPGVGKSTWAKEQLRGLLGEDNQLAHLAHICALNDFFTNFDADAVEDSYAFEASKLEQARARNEARLQLAMEAGVRPLYVDSSNLRLWELAAYAKRAKAAGYAVKVVSPDDVCPGWQQIDVLDAVASGAEEAHQVPRARLEEMLAAFEELPGGAAVEPLLAAKRGPRDAGLGDGVQI
eukprot:TRINITY_DN14691_c0_g1_i2.p1 TRINITY_DN14691_c0_g1~~TRINITY_DN14691_c0_g1_i2.p1  ORF type:complete len:583 (+),score=151.50 TRINITY_DN14691_c0_g1_i2:28-1749(+)